MDFKTEDEVRDEAGKILGFKNEKDIIKPLFMFENGIFLTKEQIIKWLNNL